MEPRSDPVIARLTVPLWRRAVGLSALAALALVLAVVAWSEPGELRRLGLALAAGVAALLASGLWRSSGGAIWLRESGQLETDGGQILALPEDIASVETGALALRPSNGFQVRLRRRHGPGWVPGLWWRFGRRLGIGGLAEAAEVKALAAALKSTRRNPEAETSRGEPPSGA